MPVTAKTTIQFLWEQRAISKEFQAGASLHSHTMYSEESLEMIPRYTAKVPYVGGFFRRKAAEYTRRSGRPFDFSRAFWTPPLTPRQAYRLEEKQVNRKFGLPAIISITDHDDIRAGSGLQMLERFRTVPISMEWTIPFGPTFFHLGVHNIPNGEASAVSSELAAFRAHPGPDRLGRLLEKLNSWPDVLLVLNHPLWDENGIAPAAHKQALGRLLEKCGRYFHALEVNGLRSWNENKEVLRLGREIGLPVVSGGDRHGREPNAILNLARAAGLVQFVHEVRYEKLSHVVFMPQYRESMKLRILQIIMDIVREYPENVEGRRRWSDRVFYREPETEIAVPLRTIWGDGPSLIEPFIRAMRLLEWRGIRSALRLALGQSAASLPRSGSC